MNNDITFAAFQISNHNEEDKFHLTASEILRRKSSELIGTNPLEERDNLFGFLIAFKYKSILNMAVLEMHFI